jgi:hypothetical protein
MPLYDKEAQMILDTSSETGGSLLLSSTKIMQSSVLVAKRSWNAENFFLILLYTEAGRRGSSKSGILLATL